MTREEALEVIKAYKDEVKIEAFDMAIKALQERTYYPPCIDCNKKMDEIRHAYDKLKEQEPSGDLISRQVVKEQMIKYGFHAPDMTVTEFVEDFLPVKQEPKSETVTEFADRCRECGAKYGKLLKQKQKEGHWTVVSDGYGDSAYICECSECKDTVWVYKDADRKWNYCPNCGARMEEQK